VDVKREAIAVKEAQRLGVPVFAIVDTNCDPDGIDYIVPANDDAIKSIQIITKTIADAVIEGKERDSSRQVETGGDGAEMAAAEVKQAKK
jgi:small subunit ribosomal protein S2